MTEPRLWPEWMDTKTAAEYLCYEVGTLENWRYQKRGPTFIKTPAGGIRYRRSDLDAWMMSGAAS